MDSRMPESTFGKYRTHGAYHYRSTLGAPSWRQFDVRLAARYLASVKLLNCRTGQRVLDAGSGEGVASILCCRVGATVSAVELDEEACRLGEELRQRENIATAQLQFFRKNLYSLPFPDASFDGILSLEVIEHMDDLDRYLGELHRLLKPQGRLVVSTPLMRRDGILQDPYHVIEFDAGSLEQVLSRRFHSVKVTSAWPGWIQRFYECLSSVELLNKAFRGCVRYLGYYGCNLFVRPCPPDPRCPLLLASAIK